MNPLALLSILSCIGLAISAGARLAGAAVPDSVDLARIHDELTTSAPVRVSGPFGTRVLQGVTLGAEGISAARWGPGTVRRPALVVGKGVGLPSHPAPIAWDQISSIEVGRHHVMRGAGIGASLGAVVGAAFWYTFPTGPDGGQGPALEVIGIPALTFMLVGGFLGSSSYEWRTVFQAR